MNFIDRSKQANRLAVALVEKFGQLEDVNFDELAEVEGLTGADIKAIVDDATRSAFLDYIDNGKEMIVRRYHFKRTARG